jgi:hypothetical protein
MRNSIGWIEKNSLNTLYQLNSIDIYHLTKIQRILTWKPMRREILKGKKAIEENSIIQKKIIEKINGTKEKARGNYAFNLLILKRKITYRLNRRPFAFQLI